MYVCMRARARARTCPSLPPHTLCFRCRDITHARPHTHMHARTHARKRTGCTFPFVRTATGRQAGGQAVLSADPSPAHVLVGQISFN